MKLRAIIVVALGIVLGLALLLSGHIRDRQLTVPPDHEVGRAGPFEGVIDVDLGTHRIDAGEPLDLDYEYKIRNVSGQSVRILKVSSTCGCTSATASNEIIEPGENVVIRATIRLSRPERRSEEIRLLVDELGVVTLKLSATAVMGEDVYLSHSALEVPVGGSMSIEIVVRSFGTAMPRVPEMSVPLQYAVQFSGWSRIHDGNTVTDAPARWQGTLIVERRGDGEAAVNRGNRRLVVTIPGFRSKEVDLSGWPF